MGRVLVDSMVLFGYITYFRYSYLFNREAALLRKVSPAKVLCTDEVPTATKSYLTREERWFK